MVLLYNSIHITEVLLTTQLIRAAVCFRQVMGSKSPLGSETESFIINLGFCYFPWALSMSLIINLHWNITAHLRTIGVAVACQWRLNFSCWWLDANQTLDCMILSLTLRYSWKLINVLWTTNSRLPFFDKRRKFIKERDRNTKSWRIRKPQQRQKGEKKLLC